MNGSKGIKVNGKWTRERIKDAVKQATADDLCRDRGAIVDAIMEALTEEEQEREAELSQARDESDVPF